MDRPIHLPQLDALRGIAAMGVLIFHMRYIYSLGINPLDGIPMMRWIQHQGWMLVDLFFVLSGFVFAHCHLSNGLMREGMTLKKFAWARIARLWPLHIAMLLFAALVMRDDPTTNWENFILSAAMLHALIGETALNSPAWSISVEMGCYGLFALAAAWANKKQDNVLVAKIAALLVVAGTVMVLTETISPLGRGLMGFFIGILARHAWNASKRIPALFLFAGTMTAFLAESEPQELVLATLIGWTSLILLTLRLPWDEDKTKKDIRQSIKSALQWLGDRSYAIYLSHVPILLIIGSASASYAITTENMLIITAVSIAVILMVSNTLYEKLERPAQKWMLNLKKRKTIREWKFL